MKLFTLLYFGTIVRNLNVVHFLEARYRSAFLAAVVFLSSGFSQILDILCSYNLMLLFVVPQ